MSTPRRISMSASRTPMRASSRRSAGQPTPTASGVRRPTTTSARANADQLDHQRSEQPAGRDAERQDRLEPGEHPREHGLVRQPGERGEAADVDERVADADHREQADRRHLPRNDADQRPAARRTARCPRRTIGRARRGRRARTRSTEPSTPPAPTAAFRTPTPASPVPSRSIATTTAKTLRQPRVNVCATPSPVISPRLRSAAMIRRPRSIARPAPPAAAARGGAS